MGRGQQWRSWGRDQSFLLGYRKFVTYSRHPSGDTEYQVECMSVEFNRESSAEDKARDVGVRDS